MNKPIAVFDLDDTLIDLKEELWKTLDKEFGNKRVPHWSLWETFDVAKTIGITTKDLMAFANKHKIFRKIKPHLFSKMLLQDLRTRGYHIIIVTSRDGFIPNAFMETRAYLRKHLLPFDELLVTPVGKNKMDSLAHHDKIHFAIDDQESNCIDFKESGKVEHVFLHAVPHNRHSTKFIRLHNLFQVYPHIGLE